LSLSRTPTDAAGSASCRVIVEPFLELQSELSAILLNCFDLTSWREDIGNSSRPDFSSSIDDRTG